MVDMNRRGLMRASVAAALGASVAGVVSADEVPESDTPGAPSVRGDLKRFSTTAFGAEVTGPFVFEDGSLLYSLQHPEGGNPEPFGRAAVGYFSGFQFEFDGSNDDFQEIGVPDTQEKQRQVRSAAGDYEVLIQGKEPIQAGSELLGVPQTPDGTDLAEFAGSSGGYGENPDCNQFVATDDEGTEGDLFTNWENYPGAISRVPLSRDEPGERSADGDSEETINVVNTEPFR
ncbi:cell surface protein, partial [Halorubrum sp. E3]